jgi:hypothetical protein
MPVILAIWEVEIGKIIVPGQSEKKKKKIWPWWHALSSQLHSGYKHRDPKPGQ